MSADTDRESTITPEEATRAWYRVFRRDHPEPYWPPAARDGATHDPHAKLAPELVALLEDWDANDEDDNYSKGDAAADLRAALRRACGCERGILPHARRCPDRMDRLTPMNARPTVATFTIEGRRFANMNGSRGNHHAHQSLMNEWKALALAAITEAHCQPVDAPVTITATVRRTTNARADAHNVTPTIKACIDAAVTAGLIEDDHDGIVRRLIIEGGPKAGRPTIELTLEAS